MSDGNCAYHGGSCQPSDMALATSGSYVLQAVNTAVAVYSTSGTLASGFPKSAQAFFGVPNPSPAGCDSHGPFLTDPRAFYDPTAGRFWVAIEQAEGVANTSPSCSPVSRTWIAVSATSDPTGAWYVYSYDMTIFYGITDYADYTTFGFDAQAVYFGANMFPFAGGGLVGNEVLAASKSAMMAGASSVNDYGFESLNLNGTLLDTVQPVKTVDPGVGPQTGFLINSFNINSGGGQCTTGCSGIALWAFSNPLDQFGHVPLLTGTVVPSDTYTLAPQADNPPQCNACIETLDTRISGQPTYQHGQIYFGLDTGVNNGTQVVPGVYWGVVDARLNDSTVSGCTLCTTISSSSALNQQGFQYYGGDQGAYFPTLTPDPEGNIIMNLNFSSTQYGVDPSALLLSRRVTQNPGAFHDGGTFTYFSTSPTTDRRWGDYSAASVTSLSSPVVWTATQTSCSGKDWCTQIVQSAYTLGSD